MTKSLQYGSFSCNNSSSNNYNSYNSADKKALNSTA